MALPWIKVPSNATQRTRVNAAYGAPLRKIYPAGVFYASNTYGAPGQSTPTRLQPSGKNKATDPRAQNAAFWNFSTNQDLSSLGSTTNNIGGNSTNTGSMGNIGNSQYILFAVIALIAYVIFK